MYKLNQHYIETVCNKRWLIYRLEVNSGLKWSMSHKLNPHIRTCRTNKCCTW